MAQNNSTNNTADQQDGSSTDQEQQQLEAGEVLHLKVGSGIKERRIDKYLQGRFRQFSRVMIQNAIKRGTVKVNGSEVKPSFKLTQSDMVEFCLPQIEKREIEAEDIPLEIIYEDQDIIIINKQSELVVHPARGNLGGTLVNALMHYCDELSSGLGEFRPGIVHRLDRNTTGVMVVTKNEQAQWKVATQFQSRVTKKSYLAIVHGSPELDADRINVPLGMHLGDRKKYSVRQDGKEALTVYEVLERFRGYSLLRVRIMTGRTHQIRVHLSHIKHPIVGDDMYGGKTAFPWQLKDQEPVAEDPIMSRMALHAWTLGFNHPSTGKWVEFEAPIHKDMAKLLDMLRKYRAL